MAQESITSKIRANCEKSLIIAQVAILALCSFLVVGMLVVHSKIEESKFLDYKGKASLFKGLVAFYIVLYLGATVLILIRIIVHKQICGVAFAVYFIGSMLLIIMVGALGIEISNWQWTHGESEITEQCDAGASGIITDINTRVLQADKLLCSANCPCNLNHETIGGLTINVRTGAYNVQHCDQEITGQSYDEQQLLRRIEEDYSCSGVCRTQSYYLYSNVNNGVPKQTCFKPLQDHIYSVVNVLIANCTGIILTTVLIQVCFLVGIVYQLVRKIKEKTKKAEKLKSEVEFAENTIAKDQEVKNQI